MNEKNSQKDAWIALAILSSLALITMYGETMLIPAIPYLIDDFKISYNTSSWILTAYLIAGAVMTPIIGKLSDIYGKKKILMIVIVIYSVGSFLGGLSNDIFMMIISRVIQGIGLAMFPVAFAIIREKFPHEKLAIGQGIFTAVFSAGAIVGLGLGATIVEYFSWHMTFLSIVPLMIILSIVVLRWVRIDSEKLISRIRGSIDITGTLVLVGIVSTFLTGLTLLPNSISGPNNNHMVIILALFMISIALLPLFIFTQKRAQSPIMDLNLLKDTILLPTNILIMSIGVAFFIIYQTLPILIQSPTPLGFGGGPIATASVQLPFMVLSFVISILSGFLISKIGNIKPTLIGSIISTIGFFLLFIYHPSELVISLELCIIAIGLAFAEIGAFNISLVYAPLNQSGTALGITMLLFLIGMSLGPAISGIYLESFRSTIDNTNESYPTPLAYDLIFVTAVLISILSVILSLFITKKLISKTI
ncbi:MAG: MFS transporter [Thermoproteota archaeon]|nr:MFS transporter [Thermoproteota archaeon]